MCKFICKRTVQKKERKPKCNHEKNQRKRQQGECKVQRNGLKVRLGDGGADRGRTRVACVSQLCVWLPTIFVDDAAAFHSFSQGIKLKCKKKAEKTQKKLKKLFRQCGESERDR